MLEAVEHFGAASYEPQRVQGHWRHESTTYQDDLARLIIDAADTPANRAWFRAFKIRWRARLKQIELWLVSYRIDIE